MNCLKVQKQLCHKYDDLDCLKYLTNGFEFKRASS
jgi:hypothetical protein